MKGTTRTNKTINTMEDNLYNELVLWVSKEKRFEWDSCNETTRDRLFQEWNHFESIQNKKKEDGKMRSFIGGLGFRA